MLNEITIIQLVAIVILIISWFFRKKEWGRKLMFLAVVLLVTFVIIDIISGFKQAMSEYHN